MLDIHVVQEEIIGLPCLIYSNNKTSKDHTVIMVHGFNNDKFEGSSLAMKLSGIGYRIISFDMDGHGDRYRDMFENVQSDVDFGRMLFQLIEKTSREVMSLFNEIESRKKSIIGISLGANVVNRLIMEEVDFYKRVSVLGALSFLDIIAYGMEKESLDDFSTQEERALINHIGEMDPKDYIKNNVLDCHWLLINGSKDDNMPAEFTSAVYEEHLKENDKIIYREEDEYHFFSNDMVNMVIDFMNR